MLNKKFFSVLSLLQRVRDTIQSKLALINAKNAAEFDHSIPSTGPQKQTVG